MPNFLLIETATGVCSIAVSHSGKIAALRESFESRSHASNITVFADEVLKESGIEFSSLDAVVVSAGPGSYTGLRIGVAAAKGFCFALNIPLIAISTLEEMTYAASLMIPKEEAENKILFCPMIDARRMEVYCGLFDINLKPITDAKPEILTTESFKEYFDKDYHIYFFGDGSNKFKPLMENQSNSRFIEVRPSAINLLNSGEKKFRLKEFVSLSAFEPEYMKGFVFTESKHH